MVNYEVDTVVVGAGQAGIAMSEHLITQGVEHIIFERHRIVERWRTNRWDSLVANGPAWHDRFPGLHFKGCNGDEFVPKESVVEYFEDYVRQISAPVHCGVEVTRVSRNSDKGGFDVETSQGVNQVTSDEWTSTVTCFFKLHVEFTRAQYAHLISIIQFSQHVSDRVTQVIEALDR